MAGALAAAIFLSASGPGGAAFAQTLNASVGGNVQGAGAQAGALRLTTLQTPLSPSTVNGILTSSVENPSAIAPLMSPAASLSPASALAPVPTLAARPSIKSAATPVVAAAAARRGTGNSADTPTRHSGRATRTSNATALSEDASAGDAKSFGDAQFRRLGAEEDARGAGAVAEPSAAPAGPAKTSNWTRRIGLSVAGAAAAGAGALTPVVPRADAIPATASALFAFLGEAGSWIGNGLAFVLPVPELFKAITAGRVEVPVWRTGVLVAANLALGLVSAAVAGMPLWGLQNTVVAVAMMLIWPAARWSGKLPGGSRTQAVLGTAAVAIISLAIGAAMYFAAAAVVPGALTAWLGAAGVANLLVYVQAVTGGAYFLLFAPDILSIVRGQRPHGYTPGFSLAFMVTSVGFLVWSGRLAWIAEAGSPERAKWAINAWLNVAYTIVSGASWWLARRELKKKA